MPNEISTGVTDVKGRSGHLRESTLTSYRTLLGTTLKLFCTHSDPARGLPPRYRKSLEPVPPARAARRASKDAASRHLISRMRDKLHEQLTRRIDHLDLLVLMLDGIEIAHHTMVVALGPFSSMEAERLLGLWLGSTENAALCSFTER